ncbi:MAG: lantibiotic dehydratase [Acidobacteriota bacterium]
MPPQVLVRVGGLPIDRLRDFTSPGCLEALEEIWRLEEELGQLRRQAVDNLGDAVPGADKSRRRLLLAVRRDCHNGRPLDKYRGSELWTELVDTGRKLQKILDLERRRADQREAFQSLYDREIVRELGALSKLLDQQRFLHGLSLSSPSMASQLPRLRENPKRHGRRERRLASSLLRYASRAAVKLSPNSTLTRVTWARLDRESSPAGWLRLPARPWRETSTLRFRRSSLDQLAALLLCTPSPLRHRLEVTLNRSLDRPVDGVVRFLRPAAWLPDREGTLRYRPSTAVRLDVETPLLPWCMGNLRSVSMTFAELTTRLIDEVGGDLAEEVSALTEQFLDLGVLEWLCPWSVPGRHPEAELATFLGEASDDTATGGIAEALEDLVALERAHREREGTESPPSASLPHRAVGHFERAWRRATRRDELRPFETGDLALSETVLLSECNTSAGDALGSLSKQAAVHVLRDLLPWSQMVGLCGHRLEMSITLSEHLRRLAPRADRFPILDAFELAGPLWLDYRRLVQRHRLRNESWTEVFNPLELNEIQALRRLKRHLFERLLELSDVPEEGPVRLPRVALEELARQIPPDFRPPVGPCLQLQPADAGGRSWVLNRFFEGTGRYGSRFSQFMADEPRKRFLDKLLERSKVDYRGETHHFLDLMCSRSHELNARHIQTNKVLLLPGEGFDLPSPSGVPLRDLFCELEESPSPLRLVGRKGTRYLPVHLGGMALEMMPAIVQFLALFGPGEYLSPRPPVRPRARESHTYSPRLDLGNVTLRRARWTLATDDDLVGHIVSSSGADSFEAVQRLRAELSLPQRVFVLERISEQGHKPQFLDLGSPHFADIFRTALGSQDHVSLVEALPDIDDHPQCADGTSWAMEAQIDARALAPRPTLAKR